MPGRWLSRLCVAKSDRFAKSATCANLPSDRMHRRITRPIRIVPQRCGQESLISFQLNFSKLSSRDRKLHLWASRSPAACDARPAALIHKFLRISYREVSQHHGVHDAEMAVLAPNQAPASRRLRRRTLDSSSIDARRRQGRAEKSAFKPPRIDSSSKMRGLESRCIVVRHLQAFRTTMGRFHKRSFLDGLWNRHKTPLSRLDPGDIAPRCHAFAHY
jgi:hypothetical protein